jgi:hypothetical protein
MQFFRLLACLAFAFATGTTTPTSHAIDTTFNTTFQAAHTSTGHLARSTFGLTAQRETFTSTFTTAGTTFGAAL